MLPCQGLEPSDMVSPGQCRCYLLFLGYWFMLHIVQVQNDDTRNAFAGSR